MILFAMHIPRRGFMNIVLMLCTVTAGGQSATTQPEELATHRRLAQQYLSQHEPAKAVPELQAVVRLDPADTEARANLGVLLFFQAQYETALPHLKAAVAAQPGLWKIRSLLGIAERRTGDDRAGRADLEAVYRSIEDPKLKINVGRELIESYAATDELDKASEIIGGLLKSNLADPTLLYISYRIHSQMAAADMLALGLAAPDSAQTHQAIAHELQRDRDLPGTIANLRQALALDPSLPGAHFELAEALHASDDQRLRAEAESQYKLAVQTNPSDPKAAERLGDVEMERGDKDDAAAQYRRALKLQPGMADAAIGLANVLSEQGQAAEAVPLLEQVVAADPTNYLAHYRLSAIYRKLKRPDEVKRELELYQRYKDEHDKLKKVYQQMRVATPDEGTAEKQR
jgi:tetratricopeptide (TPR) repeat protein